MKAVPVPPWPTKVIVCVAAVVSNATVTSVTYEFELGWK